MEKYLRKGSKVILTLQTGSVYWGYVEDADENVLKISNPKHGLTVVAWNMIKLLTTAKEEEEY